MRTRTYAHHCRSGLLALIVGFSTTVPAQAAEYWLKAAPTAVTMPDPAGGAPIQVPMWGYASCTDSSYSTCDAVTVPGPALTVAAGDTTGLTVNLKNGLPAVPTSLVVNGLLKPMTPVWDDGSTGPRPSLTARVRSFDAEVAPGAVGTYQWSNVPPGTYLYQSGTRVQVQVQMGLYGAVTRSAVAPVPGSATQIPVSGQAYAGLNYAYDNEALLLYSEIDPAMNVAIASGTYGTAAGPTSTFHYDPKYFLINGLPHPYGAPVIEPVGSPGVTLLRFLNAGLTTHVPMIVGRHWDVIAEDGKPYPFRRNQYTVLLPAAKTTDVLFTPEIGATYPIMDRRLNLTNAGLPNGGMMAFLRFGSLSTMIGIGTAGGNNAPVAANDTYNSAPGVTLSVPMPGVLGNDVDPDGQPVYAVAGKGTTSGGGIFTLNPNGSFTYAPAPSYAGVTDTFTYVATDGRGVSEPATVTINLIAPNAPPVTVLDNFDRTDAPSLGANWSQVATTTNPPDVGVSSMTATASTIELGGQAIWNQAVMGPKQYVSFNSVGTLDNLALILKASGGGTNTAAPANLIRVRYEAGVIVVSTLMGGSGADMYVKQASFPAGANSGTLSAQADDKGLVTVFLNGVYVGGVQLPDVSVWKGGGRIGIQLQTQGAQVDDFGGGSL